MKRFGTGMLALTVAGLGLATTTAQTVKAPGVKEIMAKVNKPGGYYFHIARELRQDAPPWDEMQPQAKEMAKLAARLGDNAPPRGDKASWDGLAKAYADNARALEEAVSQKDKKAALAAAAVLGDAASCRACHKAHRK